MRALQFPHRHCPISMPETGQGIYLFIFIHAYHSVFDFQTLYRNARVNDHWEWWGKVMVINHNGTQTQILPCSLIKVKVQSSNHELFQINNNKTTDAPTIYEISNCDSTNSSPMEFHWACPKKSGVLCLHRILRPHTTDNQEPNLTGESWSEDGIAGSSSSYLVFP